MERLEVGDIDQLYRNSLILYKNKPVYVEQVNREGECTILDISTNRARVVKFSFKDFAPPARRLGFINLLGSVVYAARNPVRRYKVGINVENTRVVSLDVSYPSGGGRTVDRAYTFRCPEVADALFNKYPSLEEAIKQVTEINGACAFDKQFAVDSRQRIWYKTQIVGTVKVGAKTADDIIFNDGFEHLINLLDGNYEKSIRSIGS